jgi:hypothetical protein
MANATDYLLNLVLNHLTGAVAWPMPTGLTMGLFTDFACTTEVAGGSYARQAVTFPEILLGETASLNNATVTFAGMPATDVAGTGIYDDSNTLVLTDALPSLIVVAAASSLVFDAGTIRVLGS